MLPLSTIRSIVKTNIVQQSLNLDLNIEYDTHNAAKEFLHNFSRQEGFEVVKPEDVKVLLHRIKQTLVQLVLVRSDKARANALN